MTPFPEDLELRRAVFEKMGAEIKSLADIGFPKLLSWRLGKERIDVLSFREEYEAADRLPKIETDWQETRRLVEFMRGKRYKYNLESNGWFWWCGWNEREKRHTRDSGVEYQNDNISEAACRSFIEVKL